MSSSSASNQSYFGCFFLKYFSLRSSARSAGFITLKTQKSFNRFSPSNNLHHSFSIYCHRDGLCSGLTDRRALRVVRPTLGRFHDVIAKWVDGRLDKVEGHSVQTYLMILFGIGIAGSFSIGSFFGWHTRMQEICVQRFENLSRKRSLTFDRTSEVETMNVSIRKKNRR